MERGHSCPRSLAFGDISHNELRGNPGDTYEEEDAVTLATHPPTDPREFLSDFGLTQPSSQAAFKVFVILTTGNEAGSAGMVVTRTGRSRACRESSSLFPSPLSRILRARRRVAEHPKSRA